MFKLITHFTYYKTFTNDFNVMALNFDMVFYYSVG